MDTTGLDDARHELQRIDAQMRDLFVERMEVVRDIAAYKHDHGLAIEDQAFEAKMRNEHADGIADDDIRTYYIAFLQAVVEASKQWQRHLMDQIDSSIGEGEPHA